MTARPLYDPTQIGSVEYEPELLRLGEVAARAYRRSEFGQESEAYFRAWYSDRDCQHGWIKVARAVRDAIAAGPTS